MTPFDINQLHVIVALSRQRPRILHHLRGFLLSASSFNFLVVLIYGIIPFLKFGVRQKLFVCPL
ncbi:MAG: hypothetical protein DMG70_02785 [Acidobacteria bacterium]|nr:MAG: hypothetical protein DMG70_02785 [Acidobacteriota bacterium]PYY11371.1 MAG: hypothetical protein DMG69_04085 [Acidobacteriota bacterium]